MKILRVFSFDHAVTKLADQLLHLDDHYIYFLIPVFNPDSTKNTYLIIRIPIGAISNKVIDHMQIGLTEQVMHERKFHSIKHLHINYERDAYWKDQIVRFTKACGANPNSTDTSKIRSGIETLSVLINKALAEFAEKKDLKCRKKKTQIRFSAPLRQQVDRYNVKQLFTYLDQFGSDNFNPTSATIPKPEKQLIKMGIEEQKEADNQAKYGKRISGGEFAEFEGKKWKFYFTSENVRKNRIKVTLTAKRGPIIHNNLATADTEKEAITFALNILKKKLD